MVCLVLSLADTAESLQLFIGIPGMAMCALLNGPFSVCVTLHPASSLAPCGDVLCLGIMYPFPLKTPMSQSCASHASKHLLLITDLSTYWMWCFPPILLPRLGWGGPSINSIHSGLQSISIPTQTRKHHNSCVLLWAHPKAATGAPNIVTFLLFFFTVSSSLGPSSWSQDQKGSDLEQSMGVIIFLSDMGLLHWTKLYNRLDSPRKKASSRKGWGSSARSAQVHVNPGET